MKDATILRTESLAAIQGGGLPMTEVSGYCSLTWSRLFQAVLLRTNPVGDADGAAGGALVRSVDGESKPDFR